MKKLIVIACLISIFSFSQEINRLEFKLNEDYEKETVLPMGDNGFIIQSFRKQSKREVTEIKNEFYTTDLKLKETVFLEVNKKASVVDSYYEEGVNYALLRDRKKYFAIITSDSRNGTCKKIEGELPENMALKNMKIIDNKAFFKIADYKQSRLFFINLDVNITKEIKFGVEGISDKNIRIKDFQIFGEDILVFLGAKVNKVNDQLYIFKLDKDGVKKEMYKIEEAFDRLLTSISVTQNDNKYIITGTYSTTKKEISQGLYMGEIENRKLNFIKYYNFLDLNNFTDYLSEKRQKRIEKRKENARKEGKEYILNYNYVIHPVKVVDGGYEFLGEAFFPTYQVYTVNVGNTVSVITMFDGYQYSHATLARFDKQGNIAWDNTFSMWMNYKPYYIKKFVEKKDTEDTIDLVFTDSDFIVSKSFNKNSGAIVKDTSQEIIDTEIEGDKIRRSYSGVAHWYDNHFLIYGIQKISNENKMDKRKIFFVNKYTLTDKNK